MCVCVFAVFRCWSTCVVNDKSTRRAQHPCGQSQHGKKAAEPPLPQDAHTRRQCSKTHKIAQQSSSELGELVIEKTFLRCPASTPSFFLPFTNRHTLTHTHTHHTHTDRDFISTQQTANLMPLHWGLKTLFRGR